MLANCCALFLVNSIHFYYFTLCVFVLEIKCFLCGFIYRKLQSMWCNYLPLERLLPVIARSGKFNFCSLNYTRTLSLIAVNWLKSSHSLWLVRLINILFLLFISFLPLLFHSSQPIQFTPDKNWFLFFLRSANEKNKKKIRSLSRNYKSSERSPQFRGGQFRPSSSNKSSYSPSSNMEFLRGVYAFMQVSRSSVSVKFFNLLIY